MIAARVGLESIWLRAAAGLLGAALILQAAAARAEDAEPRQAQAAAEALFLEGRKLMADGHTEEACRRFEESRRIDPAIGTTMNLARCYLRLGRTASAWLLYRDTAANARALGQPDREAHARSELAAIEPDLANVVIRVEASLLDDRRVTVTLDGSTIPSSLLGSAMPVDPGKHQIAVSTPHGELWTGQVEVAARDTRQVAIPHLVVPPEPAPAPPVVTSTSSTTRDTAPEQSRWLTPRRKGALVFAGIGTLSAGYAVFETFRAISANDSSDPDACKVGTTCTEQAIESRERAFARAGRASIAAGVAGASFVGAGILWFLGAPPEHQVSAGNSGSTWTVSYRTHW